MSRIRVYLNPFNDAGTAYAGWQEVTLDVMWQSMGTLQLQLDVSDYDVGVFTNSGFQISFSNRSGKYSDVGQLGSIFAWTRTNTQIKITFDQADQDFQCGFVACGQPLNNEVVLYQGLIDDTATTMEITDQSIQFQVLGYESLLDQITLPYDWGNEELALDEPPYGSIAQIDQIEVVAADGTHTYTGTIAGVGWSYGPTGGSPTENDIANGIADAINALTLSILLATADTTTNLVTITAVTPGVGFTNTTTDGDIGITTNTQQDTWTLSPALTSHTYTGFLGGKQWSYVTGPSQSATSICAGIAGAMNALSVGHAAGATDNTILVGGSLGTPFEDIWVDTGVSMSQTTACNVLGASSQTIAQQLMAYAAATPLGALIFTVDNTKLAPGPGGVSVITHWDDVSGFPNQTIKGALELVLTAENSVLYMNGTTPIISARTPAATVGHTFCGPTSGLGDEDIFDLQNISSGRNRLFNYCSWQVSNTDIQVAQSPTSVAKYGAQLKQVSPVNGISSVPNIQAVLGSIITEFSSPKEEILLYCPMNYSTAALGLLSRVAIDFPLVPINQNLPLYGLAQYGVDQYPINVANFTRNAAQNYKIIGVTMDPSNKQFQFQLRSI